jgi:hypothetical protein
MAPEKFEACVRAGGKVRTKKLPGGKYVHFCIQGGKTVMGEVKSSKAEARKEKNEYSKGLKGE